ncbi:MAG TPA: glycosyltransferase family 2 protein [Dongiaceae bacterium]|jgi:glycosyltransferase involved in cell wall biosynthesis|nr:glycosyltransferase family 2 protein [Dongiaceae bacterium]
MSATPLSVIVPCFNEEKMIGDCLASARFAAEIIVVDSFSTDGTLEIARPLATKILQHEYVNPAAQKNWAIPQAAHEWILILDADERVTPELEIEIKQILQNPQHDGYWMRRRNFFWGKEIRHGNWQNDKVLRLFRRDKGRYQNVQVHEEIELPTAPGWCREKLLHYSYRSLDDYLSKLGRYSNWGADDARLRGVRATGWKMFSHGAGRFFKSYFLKQGFRDGVEGLIIAFMEGYYGFFKYARLYEVQRKSSQR